MKILLLVLLLTGVAHAQDLVQVTHSSSGVAGSRGSSLEIRPDGSVELSQFFNGQDTKPKLQGHITAAQAAAIMDGLGKLPGIKKRGFQGSSSSVRIVRGGSDRTIEIDASQRETVGKLVQPAFDSLPKEKE